MLRADATLVTLLALAEGARDPRGVDFDLAGAVFDSIVVSDTCVLLPSFSSFSKIKTDG